MFLNLSLNNPAETMMELFASAVEKDAGSWSSRIREF